MFVMCEAMKWSHLPNTGGLYEQSPELLDGFMTIFFIRAEYEEEERKKEEAKRNNQMSRNGSRPRSSGRRPRR